MGFVCRVDGAFWRLTAAAPEHLGRKSRSTWNVLWASEKRCANHLLSVPYFSEVQPNVALQHHQAGHGLADSLSCGFHSAQSQISHYAALWKHPDVGQTHPYHREVWPETLVGLPLYAAPIRPDRLLHTPCWPESKWSCRDSRDAFNPRVDGRHKWAATALLQKGELAIAFFLSAVNGGESCWRGGANSGRIGGAAGRKAFDCVPAGTTHLKCHGRAHPEPTTRDPDPPLPWREHGSAHCLVLATMVGKKGGLRAPCRKRTILQHLTPSRTLSHRRQSLPLKRQRKPSRTLQWRSIDLLVQSTLVRRGGEYYSMLFLQPEFWKCWDIFYIWIKWKLKDFQITWANILHLHLCIWQTLLSKATYIAFKLQFYILSAHFIHNRT